MERNALNQKPSLFFFLIKMKSNSFGLQIYSRYSKIKTIQF